MKFIQEDGSFETVRFGYPVTGMGAKHIEISFVEIYKRIVQDDDKGVNAFNYIFYSLRCRLFNGGEIRIVS